jgi:DNA-binding response OmpR family regulator
MTAAADAPRVLLVDAEPALAGLIEEWLVPQGYRVSQDAAAEPADAFDLIVVDIPFPRCGLQRLRRIASEHPGAPVLTLSSSFFAGIASAGAVARSLGVAGVLPKPLARESLLAAVRAVLRPAT